MDALTSQINPHFLFNTLNTVSSLIRFDPDMARGVVLKLSNILRRLLRKHETFVPLRDEVDFIDDYLDIEVIRFGPRQTANLQGNRRAKRSTPSCPACCCSPSSKTPSSTASRRAWRAGKFTAHAASRWPPVDRNRRQRHGHVAGAPAGGLWRRNRHQQRPRAPAACSTAINFAMDIRSQEGEGTQIRIEIPELATVEPAV